MAQVSLINEGQNIVEDPPTFNLRLMALTSMTIEFCKDPQIRLLVKEKASREDRKAHLFCDLKMWRKIRRHLETSYLDNPVYPPLVRRQILSTMRPVVGELIRWFANHETIFFTDIFTPEDNFDIMDVIVWTPHGTIHDYKTMLAIFNHENAHIIDRCLIGATYCLGDTLDELVRSVDIFHGSIFRFVHLINPVIPYRLGLRSNFNFFELFYWAYCNSPEALNYLFLKEDPARRYNILPSLKEHFQFTPKLINCIPFRENIDGFSTHMIRKCPAHVLVFFLDWPNQGKFFQTANQLLGFMGKQDFHLLFCNILDYKISEELDDFDYRGATIYLWENCPENIKNYMQKQWVYPKLKFIIENEIVRDRKLFVKEKVHNFFFMARNWSTYIINNYGMNGILVSSFALQLYWYLFP